MIKGEYVTVMNLSEIYGSTNATFCDILPSLAKYLVFFVCGYVLFDVPFCIDTG